MLFKQPQLSSVHNILLLPFTFELWLMVLAILFVFAFVLVLLARANDRINVERNSSPNVQDILILIHGAICQQGKYRTVNKNTERDPDTTRSLEQFGKKRKLKKKKKFVT